MSWRISGLGGSCGERERGCPPARRDGESTGVVSDGGTLRAPPLVRFGTTAAASGAGATDVAGVAANAAKSPTGGIVSTSASEIRVDLTLAERPVSAPSGTSRLLVMVVAEGAAVRGWDSGCATMQNSQYF